MSKDQGRAKRHTKSINLALQGGGSHGAFTWGVLDRMFEQDALWVEGISGTSAGAMNAVVAAQGMYDAGAAGAREALENFWRAVSVAGQASPLKRTPLDVMLGSWSLDTSPGFAMMDLMSRMASPYDLNPLDYNPLRDLVDDFIDFRKVANCTDLHIFISATNVETGRSRVFRGKEINLDVVMASACLPTMFKAVEIEGVPYWDGGFMGNPVLFPFIDHSPSSDILIVQINPLKRTGTPRRAREIQNRVNEITFNASLLRDLRTIDLIHRLIEDGALSKDEYRVMNMHMIDGCDDMLALDASSKLSSEWAFLIHLRDLGRSYADRWLKANFDKIEMESTLDLRELFGDFGAPSRGNAVELRSRQEQANEA
ncbi:MAG: patatin-like phospholipase family protein [Pseudomonadota bacterium]